MDLQVQNTIIAYIDSIILEFNAMFLRGIHHAIPSAHSKNRLQQRIAHCFFLFLFGSFSCAFAIMARRTISAASFTIDTDMTNLSD